MRTAAEMFLCDSERHRPSMYVPKLGKFLRNDLNSYQYLPSLPVLVKAKCPSIQLQDLLDLALITIDHAALCSPVSIKIQPHETVESVVHENGWVPVMGYLRDLTSSPANKKVVVSILMVLKIVLVSCYHYHVGMFGQNSQEFLLHAVVSRLRNILY